MACVLNIEVKTAANPLLSALSPAIRPIAIRKTFLSCGFLRIATAAPGKKKRHKKEVAGLVSGVERGLSKERLWPVYNSEDWCSVREHTEPKREQKPSFVISTNAYVFVCVLTHRQTLSPNLAYDRSAKVSPNEEQEC